MFDDRWGVDDDPETPDDSIAANVEINDPAAYDPDGGTDEDTEAGGA